MVSLRPTDNKRQWSAYIRAAVTRDINLMPIDRIALKNFRCFRKAQSARLAPLTLLVGENNTGKTSFLAMLRALWDVAYSERLPDFKEDPYDLGSFDEIAHYRGGRGGRADTFGAGFSFTSKGTRENISYQFTVTFKQKGTVPLPVYIRLARPDQEIWLENSEEDEIWQLRFGTSKGAWQGQMPLGFDADRNRLPTYILFKSLQSATEDHESKHELTPLQGSAPPMAEDWQQIEELILRFGLGGLFYRQQRPYAGAPVRSKPQRTYDPARPTRDPEGDYIPMYLATVQNRENWETVKDGLEQFGKTSGLFNEISVKQLGGKASGPFQVQLRKSGRKAKGPTRNLIDMGYGISQILPVITEMLRGDGPSMFLLQQPEVYLHPRAQAALGSLFGKIARPDQQLVIETHSDHLIDRVRMDVRDGTTPLTPEDVSILFFEYNDLDVYIHSLELDQEGNVLNAPPSYRQFFMEETRKSLGL